MMSIRRPLLLLTLCYIAFISLGMPDAIISVAWPEMSREFGLPVDRLGAIMVGGVAGYMLSGFFAGRLVALIGIANLLIYSCVLTVVALIGFTLVEHWWLLPLTSMLAGLSAGAIDAGLNAYVEHHYSERLMQWLHASFGIGVTLGPLIMTGSLVYAQGWRPGFWLVALLVICMAIAFTIFRKEWSKLAELHDGTESVAQPSVTLSSSLRLSSLRLSMLAFFLYTGMEVGIGSWAYTLLTEERNLPPEIAGFWVSLYWGSFTIGRLLAGVYADRFGALRLTLAGAGGAIIGLLLFSQSSLGEAGVLALALVGFCFAPVFPALMSSTSAIVPRIHVNNAVGMQISAAGFGAATSPLVAGLLVGMFGLESVPLFILAMSLMFMLILLLLKARHTREEWPT